jgi:hypothetical protein
LPTVTLAVLVAMLSVTLVLMVARPAVVRVT